jgi:DNA-binding response OmpR family regulator
MNILLAEDEPVTRLMLEKTLSGLGHEVTAVADGGQAWSTYQAIHFPVVITDWMMPNVDGLDLCRLLRTSRRPEYTYVILLTGRSDRESLLEGLDAGADDFLTKPADVEHLRARLRVAERILGLRETMRRLEGLLPICSYCKRIRTEASEWVQVEQYVERRSDASFTHGVCPDCRARLG